MCPRISRSVGRRRSLTLAAVLVVVGSAAPAQAEDVDASALLRYGVELRRAHRDEEARAVFARALALEPTPTARAQLALSEQALGRWLDAETDLRKALLDSLDDPWIDKNRPSLEDARTEIASHLGWLAVSVTPMPAEVRVDGAILADPGAEARVLAGGHAIDVRALGYTPATRHADVTPGERASVVVSLVRVAAPPSTSPPPALIHELPGQVGAQTGLPVGSMAFGVVGLVGLGIGTYFAVRTFDNKSLRDDDCMRAGGCDDRALTYDQEARRSADLATLAFGGATASLAASVLWWLMSPSSARVAPRIALAPLSSAGAAVMVQGVIR